MAHLVIIRGLPGSGKSTMAKEMCERDRSLVHVETDMYFLDEGGKYRFNASKLSRAHLWCWNEVARHLGDDRDVIVSNTFSQLWEVQPYLDLCRDWGCGYTIIECTGNFGSTHNVPETTIQRMKERWEQI